jgi:uncharacterized membrane protein
MMWWYQAGDAGWIGFMLALMLAAAIGLVLAVVLRSADRPWHAAPEGALDILRRRYAAGEIAEAEFEQAKRVLGR